MIHQIVAIGMEIFFSFFPFRVCIVMFQEFGINISEPLEEPESVDQIEESLHEEERVHVEETKPVEKTEAEVDTAEILVDKRMKESMKSKNTMVNQCTYEIKNAIDEETDTETVHKDKSMVEKKKRDSSSEDLLDAEFVFNLVKENGISTDDANGFFEFIGAKPRKQDKEITSLKQINDKREK